MSLVNPVPINQKKMSTGLKKKTTLVLEFIMSCKTSALYGAKKLDLMKKDEKDENIRITKVLILKRT